MHTKKDSYFFQVLFSRFNIWPTILISVSFIYSLHTLFLQCVCFDNGKERNESHSRGISIIYKYRVYIKPMMTSQYVIQTPAEHWPHLMDVHSPSHPTKQTSRIQSLKRVRKYQQWSQLIAHWDREEQLR